MITVAQLEELVDPPDGSYPFITFGDLDVEQRINSIDRRIAAFGQVDRVWIRVWLDDHPDANLQEAVDEVLRHRTAIAKEADSQRALATVIYEKTINTIQSKGVRAMPAQPHEILMYLRKQNRTKMTCQPDMIPFVVFDPSTGHPSPPGNMVTHIAGEVFEDLKSSTGWSCWVIEK